MVRLTRDGKEPPQSEGREWHFELSQSKPVCVEGSKGLTPSLNPEPWFSNFSVLWGHLGRLLRVFILGPYFIRGLYLRPTESEILE